MILKNLDQKILNIHGKPYQDPIGKDEKTGGIIYHDPTFRDIMETALSIDHPQEKCPQCQGGRVPEIEKYKRYEMLKKIVAAKSEVEFETEEIALIKKLINWHYLVGVVGYVYDLIEGKHSGGKQ